jgi:hypothetical protein
MSFFSILKQNWDLNIDWGRHGRDRMVVGFTTTCAISALHQYSCEFEPRAWQGVLDTTLLLFY